MERLVYKLPVFEGPLDALLFLISKNKLDIRDIPIAELLDQYLAYLADMREMSLDVTSEFLEMASRLVQIKSAMLLPRPEESGEEDPRSGLMAELIEYSTCKTMAQALRRQDTGFDCFVRPPAPLPRERAYRRLHDKSALRDACLAMRERLNRRLPPPASAFRKIVAGKIVSVMSRVVHLLRRLTREGERPFGALFEDATGRSEAVATFLALLELVKSQRIVLENRGGGELVKLAKGK